MKIEQDLKRFSRRSADKPFAPKSERLALLGLIALTVGGTLAYLIILADSI